MNRTQLADRWHEASQRTHMPSDTITCPGPCRKAIYAEFEICGSCRSKLPEKIRAKLAETKKGTENHYIALQEAADHFAGGKKQ